MDSHFLKILLLTAFWFSFFFNSGLSQTWNFKVEKDANFRIAVPEGVEVYKKNEIDHPVFGQLEIHNYTFVDTTNEKGEMVYTVFFSDYPDDLVHQDSLELLSDFFLATAEAAAYSIAGNLVYSDEIQNFHCPGYTFRIHYNQGKAVIRARAYLCCSHLYILTVAGTTAGVSTENMFKFFDSFALIQDCRSVK
jgi:hypothetical protein